MRGDIAPPLYRPMYFLYNSVLRKSPKDLLERLEAARNKYETTIFCIVSGVNELSKAAKVPSNRRVYRGLSGMIPPDQFWKSGSEAAAGEFRGGVECGFMSTTSDRDVAIQYSGASESANSAPSVVFEITVGKIDIGADLSWLSQYPKEKEILFPPLTCLEVVGEARVEDGVIFFPLHANMYTKGQTLRQMTCLRKELSMSMAKRLREEPYLRISEGLTQYRFSINQAEVLLHEQRNGEDEG